LGNFNNKDSDNIINFSEKVEIKNNTNIADIEKDIEDFRTIIMKDVEKAILHRKKTKLITIAFATYIISIILTTITAVLHPSFKPIADIYLIFSNIFNIGINVWNIVNLNKTKLIKESIGKIILVASIFGLAISVFAIISIII
jgi:hypothetical protein